MLDKFDLEEMLADIGRDEKTEPSSTPSLASQDDILSLLQAQQAVNAGSVQGDE